jgi:hypothetical protein
MTPTWELQVDVLLLLLLMVCWCCRVCRWLPSGQRQQPCCRLHSVCRGHFCWHCSGLEQGGDMCDVLSFWQDDVASRENSLQW